MGKCQGESMGIKGFYCANEHCIGTIRSYIQPNSEIGQELKDKRLCKSCVKAGYQLAIGVIVKHKAVKA